MGIFNRKITYAVHFHVGAGSDKNILACAAKNQEYLISNQELTKENEKLLMQELQATIDEQKTDDIKAIVKLEKEKLKKSDMFRPEITFEELRATTKDLANEVMQSVHNQLKTRDISFTKQEYERKIVSKMLEVDRHR
jgi:hypothetical protein